MIGTALTYLRDEVNRINLLVVNVEEEREPRRANPYYDEHNQRINPDIPLTISVLFIARFNDYPTPWNYLTDIIRFFQSNPIYKIKLITLRDQQPQGSKEPPSDYCQLNGQRKGRNNR